MDEEKDFTEVYKKHKEMIFKLENGNLSHVYLLKSNNGYWKAFGYSALILSEIFGKKHDIKIKINIDRDYHPFKEGSVSFRGLEKPESLLELEQAKLREGDSPEPDFIRAYRLKKPISKDELEILRQKYINDVEKINETLKIKKMYPDIFYNIKNFIDLLLIIYRKPRDRGSNMLLDDIYQTAIQIHLDFTLMVNGYLERSKWFLETKKRLTEISAYLTVLYNSKTIAIEDSARLVMAFGILDQSVSEKRAK